MRLYIDSFSNPLIWTVDHGPGTPEKYYREVYVDVETRTGCDLSSPPHLAKAWIEFEGFCVEHDDCLTVIPHKECA